MAQRIPYLLVKIAHSREFNKQNPAGFKLGHAVSNTAVPRKHRPRFGEQYQLPFDYESGFFELRQTSHAGAAASRAAQMFVPLIGHWRPLLVDLAEFLFQSRKVGVGSNERGRQLRRPYFLPVTSRMTVSESRTTRSFNRMFSFLRASCVGFLSSSN
jgi:hypothetical protein